MEEVKRWSVTYTKHIKQRRKVYQDGFLELHSSSHKVTLYDDCEKLLDSRFLKNDVISSGETITFGSYLVDIGDPNGDKIPIHNIDVQGEDKKVKGKFGSLHSRSFRSPCISSANLGEKKARLSNLSPSQRIIREFKKSEISKYSPSPSCPDTTKSKTTEWQILYTKNLTQKAKRFHDGFLQLALCGSQGRQVALYDTTRQLLDSRFLKKDEVIKTGEQLKFDGHLVEIEECEGGNKPLKDMSVEGRNCKIVGKQETIQNLAHIGTESAGEWDVMYTTQVNQKTKKYSCGILRVAPCGSYRMQATLVSEDGSTLGHRFLRLSEDVRTGNTLPLPNYLVEVGEPRARSQGEQQNGVCSGMKVDLDSKSSTVGNVTFGRKADMQKPAHDDLYMCEDNAAPRKNMSNTRNSTLDRNAPSSRPPDIPKRAACDILSSIKKPIIPEVIVTVQSQSGKQYHSSQVPDSACSDFENLEADPVRNFNQQRDAVLLSLEDIMGKHNNRYGTSQPKAEDEVLSGGTVNLVDSPNREECQATSSSFSLRSGATNISQLKSTTEHLDSGETRPTLPATEPQDAVLPKSDSIAQPQIESVLENRFQSYIDDGSFTDPKHLVVDLDLWQSNCNNEEKMIGSGMVPAATSSLCSAQFTKEHYADERGLDGRGDEVTGADRLVPNGFTALGPFVIEKNSPQDSATRKMGEFPSFDLGID